MEALDEPEAKASMIWILGEYVARPLRKHMGGIQYQKYVLYGSKDPLARKETYGYNLGGKVSSQEVLGYQKYEQRFHFFAGWNKNLLWGVL